MASVLSRALGLLLACFVFAPVPAATTSYEYDALGRLRVVTHDNRTTTTYALDPAGNRVQLTDAASGPTSAPSPLSVPTTSSTGNYTVTWGAAAGRVLEYELYETTSPIFAWQTRVHDVAALSASFAGKPNHTTYYYRIRACAHEDCSGYTIGSNGVVISIPPPGAPASISAPAEIAFNYSVTWGVSPGVVSTYELYESRNASFAAQTLRYSGAERLGIIRDNPNGTYYYRVRACGAGGCGSYATSNAVVVNTPPPPPAAPTNLAKTHVANCAWRATWNAVDGADRYVVRDTAGAEQTVNTLYAHVTCPINNQNANQPRWVKACSPAGVCSSAAYFP